MEHSEAQFNAELRTSSPNLEKHQEDAVNNNQSKFDCETSTSSSPDSNRCERESPNLQLPSQNQGLFPSISPELSLNEQLANSSMTLEVINNTRMTLARLASAAAQEETSDKSAHDLSLLQRALYNLQHQQVVQMQLIKQLQSQLSIKHLENEASTTNTPDKIRSHCSSPSTSIVEDVEQPMTSSFITNLMDRLKTPTKSVENTKREEMASPNLKERPLSPSTTACSLASSVIKHDDLTPISEPNTLEMLQRTANQVLSNASQGLLTNRLIDDYSETADGSDVSNKHRCRYCGKLFGSDSALQIHLRSHTGERPYKCNICGNRFTTKGNLKVHFQRHQGRFPHIKMNPHPIPENLDKLYPPLLAQLGELSDCPPAPTGPPSPFPSLGEGQALTPRPAEVSPRAFDFPIALHNPLISPIPLSQDKPENLSWRADDFPSPPFLNENLKMDSSNVERNSFETEIDDKSKDQEENEKKIKEEPVQPDSFTPEPNPFLFMKSDSAETQKFNSFDRKPVNQINSKDPSTNETDEEEEKISSPKKETMDIDSHISEQLNVEHKNDARPKLGMRSPKFPKFPFPGMRFPFPINFPFVHGLAPPLLPNLPPPPQPRPITIPPGVDPAKDPNVYNSLLPRPGSTDNSWEALIEVKKTSETLKLEALVKTIEYKLEPNQCVICNRVLSCKSALQMHYRTHTGERPFKCKICNHTFTTKGNLKTHMSVHRARPHVGMLHQCPVCHKKFGNALVLQQHIRLHTGESTDLSPEQIAAAEVRDMSANFQSFPPSLFPHGIPLPPHHPLRSFPPFALPIRYHNAPDFIKNEPKVDEEKMGQGKEDEAYTKFKYDRRIREQDQRVAQDLSLRMGTDNMNDESSSPRRSISPSPSDYSDPGMREANRDSCSIYPIERNLSQSISPAINQDNHPPPLNLVSRPPHPPFWSPFGLFPQPLTSNVLNTIPTSMPPMMSTLYMPNMPGKYITR